MVRVALDRLRGLKPFRGQQALVRDAQEQLAAMVAAQGTGLAEPGWLSEPSEGQPRSNSPNARGP